MKSISGVGNCATSPRSRQFTLLLIAEGQRSTVREPRCREHHLYKPELPARDSFSLVCALGLYRAIPHDNHTQPPLLQTHASKAASWEQILANV